MVRTGTPMTLATWIKKQERIVARKRRVRTTRRSGLGWLLAGLLSLVTFIAHN